MIVGENQCYTKALSFKENGEDIMNRGGGVFIIELFESGFETRKWEVACEY